MKSFSFRFVAISIVALVISSCSARQIQTGTISNIRVAPAAEPISEHSVIAEQATATSTGELRALNEAANTPTFGIIKGFYQLPEAFPHGAIAFERVRTFGFDYESVRVSKPGSKPYVIIPASAQETEAIESMMNQLLDATVRVVEVRLADAVKIIEAEKVALEKKTMVFPRTSIPSGVDMLVSIEKGYGSYGPIYVGRVIRSSDGQLFGLATQPDVGPASVSPLIARLVKDSLRRLGAKE